MRYLILAFLCAATVIAYIQRQGLSAPTKQIESQLEITSQGMGFVMAAWYWGYALCQIPAGWVADRLGSRSALLVFALCWSALTAISGLAEGFFGLLFLWGLMGCMQAGLFPCATKAIGSTFPKSSQAFASGALSACMAMGAAIAHLLSGQLVKTWQWHQMLMLFAVPGVVWALLFSGLVPKWRDQVNASLPDSSTEPMDWGKVLADRQMQILCAQQFFRASAVALFYTWLPRYLQESHKLSEDEASSRAFWPPLAGIPGGFLGGMFSDWLLKKTGNLRLSRQGMAMAATVVCAAFGLAAALVTDTDVVIALLCVVAFCAMAAGVSGYSVAIGYGGRRVAPIFATMNMSGNIGAGLFPLLVGGLVKLTNDWNVALFLFTCLFACSTVCWSFLKPQGTLFKQREGEQT